jgi:lysine biosynthesis protein LysW
MNIVTCTECEAEITLEAGTEVGEIIVCPDCGVDLEVVSLAQRSSWRPWKRKTGGNNITPVPPGHPLPCQERGAGG